MDQRKKNLRAVQLSHLINEYFADSVDHPVRVSADRVPTLSLVPNDPQLEPSKVVLNKHGWNPVLNPFAEPLQKASYKGEVPRSRSILREPNENHRAEHLESRLAAQLPDDYNIPSFITSHDHTARKKDSHHPEGNHRTPFTNGHYSRTAQTNSHTNDPMHAPLAARHDNSQYTIGHRTMDRAHNAIGHLGDHPRPSSPGVYGSDSSHGNVLKYDDLRGNFGRNDDQPRISTRALVGSSVKGSYLTVRDRDLSDFSIDKQTRGETRGERIESDGTTTENSDVLKRTKLGMKVRQHQDLNGPDGLEKLRQIIARQRHGKEPGGADRRETEPPNWKNTNIPPTDAASLHPVSGGASGKTSDGNAGPRVCLSDEVHDLETRLLHRNDDPVRPLRKTRHERRTVSIPRKVARAPAPPSYKGFSEVVSHKTSATATDADRRLMSDPTRKRGLDQPFVEPVAGSSRPEALNGVNRVEVQTDQTAGTAIQDGKPKKLVQFDKDLGEKATGRESSKKQASPLKNAHVEPALQKKLTKPNKSDINVRSWRAGIQVVKQELGKLPKMSHSPPTKDSSPEQQQQQLDDSAVLALLSNPPSHSEAGGVHNRMTEKHDDDLITHVQRKSKFQEKRSGGMGIVNNRERRDIGDDHSEDKEDISDQSAQAREEIHEHLDQETDEALNENDEDEDDRGINHDQHAEVKSSAKSKPLSSMRRIQKPPEAEKEKDRKISRDVGYDKEEVKLYMAKQKADRRRKEKEEQMEKQRVEENRQRQLEELSKKQKQSAGLRSRPTRTNKGKPRTGSRENSTDSGGHRHGDVSSVELSSTEERSCDKIQNSKNLVEKTSHARSDHDTIESGTERKNDFNYRELRATISEPTQKSATQHSSEARLVGPDGKSCFPTEMKNSFPSSFDSRKNSNPDIAPSSTKDAVGWSQPSAHMTSSAHVTSSAHGTSSAVDSVESRPAADGSRNFEERWASLAQSAQSLQLRLNDQANSFATALTSRGSVNKGAIPSTDKKFQTSSAAPPSVRSVWVPTDSTSAVAGQTTFLSNGYADNRDEESDSTLTEDSVAQLEKPSSLHATKFTGTNAATAEPISYRKKTVTNEQERKNSDIERWITKRERRDSDMESTITGSLMSDTESEGRADSTSANLPGHLKELFVDTGRDSDYMLKLKTMQQAHRAAMLSLQAKSQQDLILASRRPLAQKTDLDSLRFGENTFDTQSTFSDQRPSYLPGAAAQSASVLHLQSNYLPGSQFSIELFAGKHGALESSKEQEPLVHYRSLSKGSSSILTNHQPQASASFSNVTKRDRSQAEKGLDGSFDLDSSITEEEMEKSLREVLPSERQRKRLRRDGGSLTAVADQNSAKHVFESESFDTFSLNLVRDYLTQEQSRIQHQHSLLKLREQALADKTRAELAWLEQQKLKSKKGCDDSYPALRQKQKEVLEKHKKEETGLRILQDFTKQAMKMQQGSMTEIEKITMMQKTAQQLSERLKEAGVGLEDIAIPLTDTRNEDHRSLDFATTDTSRSQSPQRENGVGLEMAVDTSVIDLAQPASPMQEKIAHKLKIQLDKKYLTVREQKLRQRRIEAERLLAWKNRLDREEEEVVQLEMEAAGNLPQKRDASVGDGHGVMSAAAFGSTLVSVHYKDCCTSPFYPSPIPSTENLQQGHLEQGLPQVTPPLRQEDLDSTLKPREDIVTGSKGVVEQAACDVAKLSVEATDSVDAAVSLPTAHKLSPEELRTSDLSEMSNHRRRSSASETEESFSIPISELTSDQSDIERQVRALQEELLRKKIEVENLRKRKKKEKLKAKEDALKKKIELVNEEIEKLATMSPINFHEFGSAEPSVTSPPTESELSERSIKATSSQRRDEAASEKHLLVADIQRSANVRISTPKSDDETTPKDLSFSESRIQTNNAGTDKPTSARDFFDAKSSTVASEINERATAETSRDSPALDVTDLDDFFDVAVNSISSRPVFKVGEENYIKVGIERDEREERGKDELDDLSFSSADKEKDDEGERSEKSASSVASKRSQDSVSNRTHSSVSNKSDVVRKGTGNKNEDLRSNEAVEDTSEKSAKSISFVESKHSRPSLSDKSVSLVSSKSDNKIKTRPSKEEEATDFCNEKNTDGESMASDDSVRSIPSKASNKSQPSVSEKSRSEKSHSEKSLSEKSHSEKSHSEKSRSAKSAKSQESDDNIKRKVLERTVVDKSEEESERSASSARSSGRSLSRSSDNSKKRTAPSSSSNMRSYAEDFSAGSKQASKEKAPERAASGVEEEEQTVCRSDAEEVKTEDDISSSLSEDDGELESGDEASKFRLDLTTKQTASSEIDRVSKEKVADQSKTSSEDVNDVSKNNSLLAEDAKDLSKTSLSSDDNNLMKERLLELPSETDIQNESVEQTPPSVGNSRVDAVEVRSLSGAGDSELERVISSAAAAVELFEDRSPNALSVVLNEGASSVGARGVGSDVLADETVTGLVSEAISEVLAIKSKKETTSSAAESDNDALGGTGSMGSMEFPSLDNQQKPEQRTPTPFALFDDWADGEFLDDDLDWSPARNTPPPPPYTEGPKDDLGSQKQPASLRLPGLTIPPPEPPIVVPHTPDELLPLADQVVDIFWHLRRCGESWDDVQPTQEYFGPDANALTPELSSRRMYKQMIFEVVAEFLRDMYRDDEEADVSELHPLLPSRPTKWKQYYKEQDPPKTLDILKPVVRLHVMHTVGQQAALQKVPRKWSTRRKDDGVDRVLVKELHEEEPEWVNYESDTFNIKMQLTDAIFQLLLTDTANTLKNVQQRIAVHHQRPKF